VLFESPLKGVVWRVAMTMIDNIMTAVSLEK